jgi:hypothetical protein
MKRTALSRLQHVGKARYVELCSDQAVRSFLLAVLGMFVSTSSAVAAIVFSDRSGSAHVSYSSESYGAAFGDLNGDGFPEIYTSNHRMQDALYLNLRNGSFYRIDSQVFPWRYHKGADTHGGTFADIDNDGDQDLFISTGANNPSVLLYNENQRLVDRTKQMGVEALSVGGRQVVWLDYDHDKLLDFVLTQFGGTARLYHQEADGSFTNQTATANFVCTKFHYGQLYDANNDGRLDFLCPDQDIWPQRIYDTSTMPWTKIFEAGNLKQTWFPRVPGVVDSVIADFDNDGRQDIFLLSNTQLHPSAVVQGNSTHFESLLANGIKGFKFVSSGRITFTPNWNQADESQQVADLTKIEIGASAVHPASINFTLDPANSYVAGMPPPPTDQTKLPIMQVGFDRSTLQWTLVIWSKLTATGPGVFSVAYMQVDSTSAITGLKSTGFWPGDYPAKPTLLMNRPGGYVDETVKAGLDAPISCVSATAGDFDNDMDVDLYLACRTGASNIANILLENLGNGTFRKVTSFGAAGPVGVAIASGAGTADSVISGDYDVDGRLDLFVTNGLNLQPRNFGGPNKLFHNDSAVRHWIEIDLVGKQSDRDATGAKIYATAGGVEQLRVQNGGYHRWSQDSKRAHFGLAGYTSVDLRVEWPSGNVQTFNNVAANKLYRITENAGIAAEVLGVAPAYPCGAPTLNGWQDKGAYVWRDCATGVWSMRVLSANTTITYQGTITSGDNFTTVQPRALETNDVVSTPNPKQIAFTLVSSGTGVDGVDFKLPDGASACLRLPTPSGSRVFMGPFKDPIANPINLETQKGC